MYPMESVFVSSHDGIYVSAGGNRNAGVRNSYEIWKNPDGTKYVKMKVLRKGELTYTFFDHDDLEKVLAQHTWYVTEAGYVTTSAPFKYLHHIVMDFVGTGRGFQQVSIDHINRDPLDNRKQNLRRATPDEQRNNSKGIAEGTKRTRNKTAKPLPDGLTELPKHVIYYTENIKSTVDDDKTSFRDFFRIEKHPAQMCIPPLFKDKWATSKKMKDYTIHQKLEEAKTKLQEMNKALLEKKTEEAKIQELNKAVLGQTVNA